MKILAYMLMASLVAISACSSKTGNRNDASGNTATIPVIIFSDTLHDFGSFPADSALQSHTFTFTNTGDAPAAVVSVDVSCRCISAEYTRTIIRPGEQGMVTLTFDGSKSSPGYFDKSARMRFNTPQVHVLRICGRMGQ